MAQFTDSQLRELAASFLRYGSAYAEGTFTPTYYGGTTAGVTTYSTLYGAYTRIGNVCFFWLRVAWSSATGTGSALVGGLPFASDAATSSVCTVLSTSYGYTNAGLRATIGAGLQYLQLWDQVTGGFTAATVDTAAELIISGAYLVA